MIGAGVTIGRNAVLHPHVTIYPGVRIGDDFTCHSQVSIREGVIIGNRVTLFNGAVIGADGFGFVEHGGDLIKVPQVGSVRSRTTSRLARTLRSIGRRWAPR